MASLNSRDIEILLDKYLEKNCTPEELQQLYQLLSSSDNERLLKRYYFQI